MPRRPPPPPEPHVSTEEPAVIGRLIVRVTEKVVKFVTLEVHSNLSAAPQEGGTPVKTGFARASWVPAVGQVNAGVAGSKENVDSSFAAAGIAQVVAYRLNQGAAFVSSNVPYILMLNDGWSPQAPPGFVDSCVLRAVNDTEAAFQGGL